MLLPFKVYDGTGTHQASAAYAFIAAELAGRFGYDATVRYREYGYSTILWREGHEAFLASRQPKEAAAEMMDRRAAYIAASRERAARKDEEVRRYIAEHAGDGKPDGRVVDRGR